MKKALSALLCALVMLAGLCGCIPGTQIKQLALVEAVGIDLEEDGSLRLTLQIFAPRGSGSGTPIDTSKNNCAVLTATGKTIREAVENADQAQSKTMFLGHNRLLILGEKLAQSGVEDILSYFDRSELTSQNARVLVSEGEARDIVSTDVEQEILAAEYIEEMVLQGEKSGAAVTCSYTDFSMALAENGCVLLPRIRLLSEEEQAAAPDAESTEEGDESMALLNRLSLDGTVLLQNFKAAQSFTKEETTGLSILLEAPGAQLLTLSEGQTALTLHLRQSSASLSLEESGAGVSALLLLSAKAGIDELLRPGEQEEASDFSRFESLGEQALCERCRSAYEKIAAQGADVLNLLSRLCQKDEALFARAQNDPEAFLKQVSLRVEVSLSIDRTGTEANHG